MRINDESAFIYRIPGIFKISLTLLLYAILVFSGFTARFLIA
jgi:hypothetical protein